MKRDLLEIDDLSTAELHRACAAGALAASTNYSVC